MVRFVAALALVAAALAPRAFADDKPTIAGVTEQKTVYGQALADQKGLTLYSSDADEPGKPACDDACARRWPPFVAPRLAKPVGAWTIALRADGTRQWQYQGKPLYRSALDAGPGDAKGEAAEKGWHAALLARNFVPAGVLIRPLERGPTFVTADGRTLYMVIRFNWNPAANATPRHDGAGPGTAACVGDCLKSWTPLAAPADAKDQGDWTVLARDDGSKQWAWKGHPLYTYAEDKKPGDALGEGNHTLDNGVSGLFWESANILL